MAQHEADDRPDVRMEIHRSLVELLPWTVSVLLHMGLVLVAFFVVWSMVDAPEEAGPVVQITADPDVPPTFTPPPPDVRIEPAAASSKIDRMDLPRAAVTLADLRHDPADIPIIGVSTDRALPSSRPPGGIFDDGDGPGPGGDGHGRPAVHVFVIDASGSLIDSLPYVISNLRDRLLAMGDDELFSVIFFQRDMAIEVPPAGLKRGADARAKVIDWITLERGHIRPRGSSNPLAALKLALSRRPDVIWLLSDNITGRGRYELAQDDLLASVRQFKRQYQCPQVRINTIQFLYADPLGTLKAIAEEHRGLHRFVDAEQVGMGR
jgi:hypothetical protein